MKKTTMELVWHSCTNYLPKENYNECLFITDGLSTHPVVWCREEDGKQRFRTAAWDIEPGVNSEGYWWADLYQTVRGYPPLSEGRTIVCCPECDAELRCMVVIGRDESCSGKTERLYQCDDCLSSWEATEEEDHSFELKRYFFG